MPPTQGEGAPSSFVRRIRFPVERRLPALLPHHVPALGKPKFGARVCAIRYEVEILTARDKTVCDLKRLQIDLVARGLIVEAEIERVRRVERITNLDESPVKAVPLQFKRWKILLHYAAQGTVCGMQRTRVEGMFDVGKS
jgi:hypothetical protein